MPQASQRVYQENLPLYLGFFEFVHNAELRRKGLLQPLINCWLRSSLKPIRATYKTTCRTLLAARDCPATGISGRRQVCYQPLLCRYISQQLKYFIHVNEGTFLFKLPFDAAPQGTHRRPQHYSMPPDQSAGDALLTAYKLAHWPAYDAPDEN